VTARKRLREELSTRFVPLLRQRGFEGPERLAGNAVSHDFRRRTATGVQVLSIQFEKYQRPRCVLNLWVAPPEGIEEALRRGGTVVQARVQPRPGPSTRHWFRADRPLWHRLLGNTSTLEREAASEVVALLGEIDRFWQSQAPSPHVSILSTSYRRAILPRRYSILLGTLHVVGIALGLLLLGAFMYALSIALGIPLRAGRMESRLKFIAWLFLGLLALPVAFVAAMRLVRVIVALVMMATGRFTLAEAKAFAGQARFPERWLQPRSNPG
jgi:hypothetical protein